MAILKEYRLVTGFEEQHILKRYALAQQAEFEYMWLRHIVSQLGNTEILELAINSAIDLQRAYAGYPHVQHYAAAEAQAKEMLGNVQGLVNHLNSPTT